jgi:iron complex transport system permease protein
MTGSANGRLFAVAVLATAGLGLLAIVAGPADVTAPDAIAVLLARVGLADDPGPLPTALVWDLRVPRAILVAVVGGALGAAGTITQGLFRNPLAEPGVLGLSAGAAATAVLGFALGLDAIGPWMTPLLAAVGAVAVLAVLLALSRPVGGLGTLLLSGVALGALASAVTTLVLSMATERWDLGLKVVRWLMGSFEGRSWPHLGAAIGPVALGLLVAMWLRLDLDALQLGPETARSLGIDLRRTRRVSMVAVGLLVGTATAIAGVIGFVGLVVPHVARTWTGAGHRALLPVATVGGAALMLVVDTATRMVPDLALPPGAITSLLGAPFFLWILRRHQGELA